MQTDVALASYQRLCFSALRYYPVTLRDRLRQEGLWEDLEQELQVAAWEAEREKLDIHDACLLAGRRIYAFLKAYGYREIRRNGHKSYVKDKSFSSIAEDPELLEKQLTRTQPISEVARPDFVRWKDPFDGQGKVPRRADSVRDHPEEAILTILRKTPGGMSKRDLYSRLVLTARELDRHCAPLIKQSLVVEVRRQGRSRPPTPLLIAMEPSQQLPLAQVANRDERIRHAYFQEGKSIKRIARELHHARNTVRKAIAPGLACLFGRLAARRSKMAGRKGGDEDA